VILLRTLPSDFPSFLLSLLASSFHSSRPQPELLSTFRMSSFHGSPVKGVRAIVNREVVRCLPLLDSSTIPFRMFCVRFPPFRRCGGRTPVFCLGHLASPFLSRNCDKEDARARCADLCPVSFSYLNTFPSSGFPFPLPDEIFVTVL